MPESDGKGGWFASLPNDSTTKILIMAVALCLVCSVAVSTTAVALKPLQTRNANLAREWHILRVAGLLEEGVDQSVLFEQVDTRFVDMSSGEFTDTVDPASFDLVAAARDPEFSETISGDEDVAGIGVRMRYMPVYLVEKDGNLDTVVLPVWTKGLYSTLRGFMALEGDGNTVKGITFYEDGETPGLGGEINNSRWQATWSDKQVFDDSGAVRISVNRSQADPLHDIDALSGATLTSRGVDNMLRFWMGGDGYGPFLQQLKTSGAKL